jgi:hypothetical protein|tara:strand:+ start:153 stop:380 length:228 start_codon:yes stop_codon:yes gene_type:complete
MMEWMTIWVFRIILDANYIDTYDNICRISFQKAISTCAVNSHYIMVYLYFYFYMCIVGMFIKINRFKQPGAVYEV